MALFVKLRVKNLLDLPIEMKTIRTEIQMRKLERTADLELLHCTVGKSIVFGRKYELTFQRTAHRNPNKQKKKTKKCSYMRFSISNSYSNMC